uniref:C-type lectin domain-containing protein n=1 Tax=Sinocyclocheilus anshuiensis TaxID=1608454 RepID=A0A671RIF6_9TELE
LLILTTCVLFCKKIQNTQFSYSSQHHFIAKALRCSGPDWYEFGEFCYKPFEEKKTWHSARTACRQLGADLVSIRSMTEQSWLESYLYQGTTVWRCYHWSEGTPVSHTNWGHGEPNNHNGQENCVEMKCRKFNAIPFQKYGANSKVTCKRICTCGVRISLFIAGVY